MTDLRWTTEKPTKKGNYWWIGEFKSGIKSGEPQVVWIGKPGGLVFTLGGYCYPIEDLTGQWAGPIEPPGEAI